MFPCLPGISLRKGLIVIGALEIASGILAGLFYSLGLIAVGDYQNLDEIRKFQQGSFVIPFVNLEGKDTSVEDVGSILIILFSFALMGCLVYCMVGVLLIIATRKGEARLLKIWMGCQSLFVISALIYILVTLLLGYTTALSVICDFVSTCVQLYFLWVVYCHIVKLRDDQFTISPSIRKSGEKIEVHFPLDTFEKL